MRKLPSGLDIQIPVVLLNRMYGPVAFKLAGNGVGVGSSGGGVTVKKGIGALGVLVFSFCVNTMHDIESNSAKNMVKIFGFLLKIMSVIGFLLAYS